MPANKHTCMWKSRRTGLVLKLVDIHETTMKNGHHGGDCIHIQLEGFGTNWMMLPLRIILDFMNRDGPLDEWMSTSKSAPDHRNMF